MMQKNAINKLIIVATLLRIIIATTLSLGNDEVYYLTYAQHLQWNYFDHPPLVAILIKITTCNLIFQNEFFVRLGPIILAAINTYLIYKMVKTIQNEKAAFIASLLYTTSFYSSIIAGVFIMPDSPQLFFWIVSIYVLVTIISIPNNNQNYNLLLFGLVAGLCIMSKVHGVFLWIGFGLYIVFYNRKLLTNPFLYLSLIITLIIISPILIWNINNNFATYTFHSNRVTINNHINIDSFIREFLGGIFYNNPINYVLSVIALIATWKNSTIITTNSKRLLQFLSLPLIVILLFVALFRDTLPHWSGPAHVVLIIITASFMANQETLLKYKKISKWATYSCVLTIAVVIIGIPFINFYPGTIGDKNEQLLGSNDFTLDLYRWDFFKNQVKEIRDNDIKLGKTSTSFIINNRWFPGSHIDNYIAQPLGLDFVAIGNIEQIHTYYWLNNYRKALKQGDDAYYITTSNNFTSPETLYKNLFKTINPPKIITQYRSGKPVRKLYVYLLKNYLKHYKSPLINN